MNSFHLAMVAISAPQKLKTELTKRLLKYDVFLVLRSASHLLNVLRYPKYDYNYKTDLREPPALTLTIYKSICDIVRNWLLTG